jgi:predicted dinucleotide-binding enzyme
MNAALLGATGDIGEALALRWARDTDEGLRARRAGGLDNAGEVESLALLLINVGEHDPDCHDVWVRFG